MRLPTEHQKAAIRRSCKKSHNTSRWETPAHLVVYTQNSSGIRCTPLSGRFGQIGYHYKLRDSANKKLSYRRGTARCVVSIEILPIATQQYRNYLYDKS